VATFVLLHGAWHGGWAWRKVEPYLRSAGHKVLTPTLTGVSDRAHLLSPAVGLDTHVTDVVALLDDGTAVSWGRNAFGQVGNGTVEVNQHRPVPVAGLKDIKAVVPGGGQTLYLLEDGTVWGAGGGFFGLLGPANMRLHPVPVRVDGIDEVTQLISGGGHAIALRADGSVWTWGRDDYGQLGDGPDANDRVPGRTYQEHAGRGYDSRPAPHSIDGLGEVRSLAGGGGHSVAIQTDGTVWTWGDNDRGQLGHGDTEHLSSPKKVDGITTAVAATCALTR